MHPRNPFKSKKPDFKKLSIKHEGFRKQAVVDVGGAVHLDFKKPEALKALSEAIMIEYFDLKVNMPLERLIPAIPLRVNYILWLEDIFSGIAKCEGIDIGTGASCVYPLICAKKNGWHFTATESDSFSYEQARCNVRTNSLESHIKVVKVDSSAAVLADIVAGQKFDFCMCNPPFYRDELERWGKSRSDQRAAPRSVSTASASECITDGGEVKFVQRIIHDSLKLREQVRVYTSMVGKKSSLKFLKSELKDCKVPCFSVTKFCQGFTMRWGIAWSFDSSISFPKEFEMHPKDNKGKKGHVLSWSLENLALTGESVLREVEQILLQLQCEVTVVQEHGTESLAVRAHVNTWSHQRRRKREKRKCDLDADRASLAKSAKLTPSCDASTTGSDVEDSLLNEGGKVETSKKGDMETLGTSDGQGEAVPLADFVMTTKRSNSGLALQMVWHSGREKQSLHQILQHLKNHCFK